MDHYLVSARKYRPSTFKSVVGQKALTATLKNAVASGRLAHSYLFCGSRGVGKTSCARIFAKTINCEHPTPDGEACNECASCRAFNAGSSMNIIELDAASNNGVDAIRDLVELTQNPPSTGRYRVFIVDEVHMLSSQAFNAFLKTLEEPPSYVVFILATTEKQKILPTILSRCQIYDFARITIQDIIDHLSYVAGCEGITADPAALNVIARKADGAMRDALSIFDQVAACSMGNITYQAAIDSLNVLDYGYYSRLLDCFLNGQVLDAWLIYKEIRDKGFDSHFFINGLASYFRDLMVAQSPETIHLIEAGDDTRHALAAEAARCHPQMIYKAMSLLNDADLNYRNATNKQFLTELTLAKICQLSSPSQSEGSHGEGQPLRQIAATTPRQAAASAAAPAPQAATAQPQPQPQPQSHPRQQPQQPQPQARPAAQEAAPRRMPPRPHGASPLGGLRINNLTDRNRSEATVGEPRAAAAVRSNPFSDEEFAHAWDSFIAAHPTEHILINSMRSSRPVRNPQTQQFVMTVENEVQRETILNRLPELHRSLRDSLQNDSVSIAVEINSGESSPVVWNEREVLDHMKSNIPDLVNYINDFQLTLG